MILHFCVEKIHSESIFECKVKLFKKLYFIFVRMRVSIKSFLALVLVCFVGTSLKAQDLIQITGVTMTADSLMSVPYVTIELKGKNRGDVSSNEGVFSLVCNKGDVLVFSSLGYKEKEFMVPADITGNHFSMIQLMTQDTFYLPETIITDYFPSGAEFDYAFKYWDLHEDMFMVAKRNVDEKTMKYYYVMQPQSGSEAQSNYMRNASNNAVYYGQVPQQNIMNPLKWAEFINAWKRGDFRKK